MIDNRSRVIVFGEMRMTVVDYPAADTVENTDSVEQAIQIAPVRGPEPSFTSYTP
jgi:hypothetical protein